MADTLDAALAAATPASTIQEVQIDSDLRTISIPAGLVLGVYNDNKTHRIYFRMPKVYSGIDLSDFKIRINYQNAMSEGDQYEVTDSKVDVDDLVFSWLVSSFAYVAAGDVTFSVCMVKTDSVGKIIQEFNTTTATLQVLEGFEPEQTDAESDVMTALQASQSAAASSATAAANSASAASSSATNAAASAQKAAGVVSLPATLSNARAHANLYRGQSLGSSITDGQLAAIKNGTFDDLYIGDYWTINGTTYRIADFDYWYNKGDTAFTKHHVVIVNDPDPRSGDDWYGKQMNDSNTTEGAYVGSNMYSTTIPNIDTIIAKDFGSANVLTHREHLQNATTNGYSSGGTWFDVKSVLMNEPMVYGHYVFEGLSAPAATIINRYTIDNSQLALFRLNPSMVNQGRAWWWLRDVVSSAHFAYVGSAGNSACSNASAGANVRVAFPVGA